MKKILLISLFILLPILISAQTQVSDSGVYVCLSKNAKKYHSHESCRGLNRCKSEIAKISKSEAQERGYSACKICY